MHKPQMSGGVDFSLNKYFVTIDDEEFEEIFFPDAQCVFCQAIGAYRIDNNEIPFCKKCLFDNYKNVRIET